jgi:dihydropteroate synthase
MRPRKRYVIPLRDRAPLQLGERTLVMGILNITPDSFSDGGLRLDPDRAVADGLHMIDEGADVLDVGGESTRPGAVPLPADEEMRRVLPVVERLAADGRVPISIDTYKAVVAREAIRRGATIVNDISGLLYDSSLGAAAAETGAALVLMHTRGRSHTMYEHAVYRSVVDEVSGELRASIERAVAAGVNRESIIIDPGFGFAKRPEHSMELLAALERLSALDRPILSGPSRKSFLKAALGDRMPPDREWGTAAAVTASVLSGAHIVRVHGVREMVDVVRVADAIRDASLQTATSTATRAPER